MATIRIGRWVASKLLGNGRSAFASETDAGRVGKWMIAVLVCLVFFGIGGFVLVESASSPAPGTTTQPDAIVWVSQYSAAASILSFLLSLVILMWTVLDSVLSKRSVDILEGVVPAILHESDKFLDHASRLNEFFRTENAGVPKHAILVISSLAYGILGRNEKKEVDPCADLFLQLLESWIAAWERKTTLEHPATLELIIWPEDKHHPEFSNATDQAKKDCLPKLIKLLERLEKLDSNGRVKVHVKGLFCEVVRVFLVATGTTYRCSLVMMTRVSQNDGPRDNRYLLWQSDQSEAFEKFKNFVNSIQQDAQLLSDVDVLKKPKEFVKRWFNFELQCDEQPEMQAD